MAIVNFLTSYSYGVNGVRGEVVLGRMEGNRRKILHVWYSNCNALLLWRCVVVTPQIGPTIRYNASQIGLPFGKQICIHGCAIC
jgi:hypothetical protein